MSLTLALPWLLLLVLVGWRRLGEDKEIVILLGMRRGRGREGEAVDMGSGVGVTGGLMGTGGSFDGAMGSWRGGGGGAWCRRCGALDRWGRLRG